MILLMVVTLSVFTLITSAQAGCGAIAIDGDGAIGVTAGYGLLLRSVAEQEALNRCGNSDCQVVATQCNRCAVMAVTEYDSEYTIVIDSNQEMAETKARLSCMQRYDKFCSVGAYSCY